MVILQSEKITHTMYHSMKRFVLVALMPLLMLVLAPVLVEAGGWKAKHVVLIGVDGWASHNLDEATNIPNIRWMMQNGSYTLKKRSVLPSASAINWASLFMGGGTEMTGYTQWNSKTPEIPSLATNSRNIFPTIYSVLREQFPKIKTALTFDWDGIGYVTDTAAIDFVKYEKGPENEPEVAIAAGTDCIRKVKPEFITIYIGGLDETGHAHGWYTAPYYEMLTRVDNAVGEIFRAVKDAGIYDNTIFILTSDHGGINKGHGGMTLEEMETPFVVCGKNIRKGYVMKDPMMQFDVAATIACMFNAKLPKCWRGRPMEEIFR